MLPLPLAILLGFAVEAGARPAPTGDLQHLLAAGRVAIYTEKPGSIMDRINEMGLKVCEKNPDNPACATFTKKDPEKEVVARAPPVAAPPVAAGPAPAPLPLMVNGSGEAFAAPAPVSSPLLAAVGSTLREGPVFDLLPTWPPAPAPAEPPPAAGKPPPAQLAPEPPAPAGTEGWVRAQVVPEDRLRADRGELLRDQREEPQQRRPPVQVVPAARPAPTQQAPQQDWVPAQVVIEDGARARRAEQAAQRSRARPTPVREPEPVQLAPATAPALAPAAAPAAAAAAPQLPLPVPPRRMEPLPPLVPRPSSPSPESGGPSGSFAAGSGGGPAPRELEPFGSGSPEPDFALRGSASDPWNLVR